MHPLAASLAVLPVVVAITAIAIHGYRLVAPERAVVPAARVVSAPPVVRAPVVHAVAPPVPIAGTASPAKIAAPAPRPSRGFPIEHVRFARPITPIPAPARFPQGSSEIACEEFDDVATKTFARPNIHDTPTRVVHLPQRARR